MSEELQRSMAAFLNACAESLFFARWIALALLIHLFFFS